MRKNIETVIANFRYLIMKGSLGIQSEAIMIPRMIMNFMPQQLLWKAAAKSLQSEKIISMKM